VNEIVWWCFHEIKHLMDVSGLNYEDAVRMAEYHAFQVIKMHNLAVQKSRIPANKDVGYYLPIEGKYELTDSQVTLLLMLSTKETYKLPRNHELVHEDYGK